jgi:exonuclease VII small subunit
LEFSSPEQRNFLRIEKLTQLNSHTAQSDSGGTPPETLEMMDRARQSYTERLEHAKSMVSELTSKISDLDRRIESTKAVYSRSNMSEQKSMFEMLKFFELHCPIETHKHLDSIVKRLADEDLDLNSLCYLIEQGMWEQTMADLQFSVGHKLAITHLKTAVQSHHANPPSSMDIV